jgi:hypothetical protein
MTVAGRCALANRAAHRHETVIVRGDDRSVGQPTRVVPGKTRRGEAMSNGSAWNAIMQYSFLSVFAKDGVIDAEELAMLERLALEDGRVDEKERAVLSKVFARITEQTTEPAVWDEIQRFKQEFGIS